MSYEKHWLERVDSMIRKSKQQVYVDIGDICEDIMVRLFKFSQIKIVVSLCEIILKRTSLSSIFDLNIKNTIFK